MRNRTGLILLFSLLLSSQFIVAQNDSLFIWKEANPHTANIAFYCRNQNGAIYNNFEVLQNVLDKKNKKLLFAMNGGMYHHNYKPVGLYIEDGDVIVQKETGTGKGNFYMKPNGIFYITKEKDAYIMETDKVDDLKKINYATQSGPMLLLNGDIPDIFIPNSTNLQIRNGVGINSDGNIIFAISKVPVSFFDFASFFKEKGCINALYLDGFVSRIYWPEKGYKNPAADISVIIGITD